MNKERLKELLDHIGNEANLLHQAKLKRKVVQAFMDLLEDKQNMLNFFDEYSKKSIEVEKQNNHYRESINLALNHIHTGNFTLATVELNKALLKEVEQ